MLARLNIERTCSLGASKSYAVGRSCMGLVWRKSGYSSRILLSNTNEAKTCPGGNTKASASSRRKAINSFGQEKEIFRERDGTGKET